jgi:hypothetical protein
MANSFPAQGKEKCHASEQEYYVAASGLDPRLLGVFVRESTYSMREQNIDNLKAGVIQADWFDPEINPKLEEFARHYGTVILPTKPAMPRHKGKVEAGVKFAQNNAVKGRTFESLAAQNLFLSQWERTWLPSASMAPRASRSANCLKEKRVRKGGQPIEKRIRFHFMSRHYFCKTLI